MKNILFPIASLLLIASCSHQNIKIDLVRTQQISPILNENNYKETGGSINESFSNIEVIDIRQNKDFLGTKEYGDEEVEIINDQDLANLIKYEIMQNLKEKNQYIDKDKTLKITLKTLKYNSQRGFFLGRSKVKIALKAALINNDNNRTEYGRTYNLENDRPHFIISLQKTDKKTINSALRDSINRVTQDNDLKNALINQDNLPYGYGQ
ncbi:MAG: putative lipoprotein YajG [Rickettsiales bacterium]|jgi:uncharacterized lipoprotein YajG